jgi:hypothetical protein
MTYAMVLIALVVLFGVDYKVEKLLNKELKQDKPETTPPGIKCCDKYMMLVYEEDSWKSYWCPKCGITKPVKMI